MQLPSEKEKAAAFMEIAKNCHRRAHEMIKILHQIKEPTAKNIGMDGSSALILLAQHAYIEVKKEVLAQLNYLHQKDPSCIPHVYIPALTDKVMVFEEREQLYGSQWFNTSNGHIFLIKVRNFDTVNERRKEYGLKPISRPVNLAVGAEKYPLGTGFAVSTDQKELTDEEYEKFTRFSQKSLV